MLLRVENLSKTFKRGREHVHVLRSISFTLKAGNTLAIVGESGSGKTTLARVLMGIESSSGGTLLFQEQEITPKNRKTFCRSIQMVFQDPFVSFNPRMTVKELLREPLHIHGVPEQQKRIEELLDLVALPKSCQTRFPHEFSGGQQQRLALARALALNPRLIICDEPTASLDVSIQAQIINLLLTLQQELGISYLLITHNLPIARILAHDIQTMHQGTLFKTSFSC